MAVSETAVIMTGFFFVFFSFFVPHISVKDKYAPVKCKKTNAECVSLHARDAVYTVRL